MGDGLAAPRSARAKHWRDRGAFAAGLSTPRLGGAVRRCASLSEVSIDDDNSTPALGPGWFPGNTGINAQFGALTCTATSAVLGSAGATQIFANFPNAPKANTWHSYALANKLKGADAATTPAPQINANFNVNRGQANCLTGTFWYYGLDGNHGTNTDFVAVLQHEMAHGLGFQTFTSGSTGA